MSTEVITQFVNTYLVPLGWKLIGAVVVWIIGGWVINLLVKALSKSMQRRKIDATLVKYAEGGAKVALRILLVIVIFSLLGIETTSFAALLAAAGVAIGAAWAGLLAHFAAGVFLVFLRPFKVGDAVTVGGVSGTVIEIGLFSTAINTGDNVRVYVGNNAIFSGNIQNYSTNPYRRVDLTAQIAHETVPADAIQRIQEKLSKIPNVLSDPKPVVEILNFNEYGTLLAVRPFCVNDHYWQVYFDVNKALVEVGTEGGYKVPAQRMATRSVQ
jgi:small conductance mechanosensitive channel